MILGIYAIRDQKTGYLPITVEQNDLSAIRNFEHAAQNVKALFYTHPEDFDLYKLGSYDNETGAVSPQDPVCIMTGFNAKNRGE